jgi:restriction system protein
LVFSAYRAVLEEERIKVRDRGTAIRDLEPIEASDRSIQDEREISKGALSRDEVSWKSQLLELMRSMEPSAFERLAQRLLREAGFTKVEVRGKTGDGGIDGVGVLRVNLVSFQVFFQCKRYKGSVSSSEIRDFRGAMMGRADKGLFITTGTFTSQASDEATRDGATAIDLIDGDRLCDLLKENSLGVSTRMIEQVDIDGDWFNAV